MIKNQIIKCNLKKQGIINLTPMQSMLYQLIYNRNNTLLSSPTGTGKTLGYLIPLLDLISSESSREHCLNKNLWKSSPQVLILSPSQVLNSQILLESIKIGHGIGLKCFMFPFLKGIPQRHYSHPDILISTVGGLGAVKVKDFFSRTRAIVMDEADYLLDQKETKKLLKNIPRNIQKVFVGATLTRTKEKIQDLVKDVQIVDFTSELRLVPINIVQILLESTQDINQKIIILLNEVTKNIGKHLVFVNTVKAGVDLLTKVREKQEELGLEVLLFNGEQTLDQRLTTLQDFKQCEKTTILITTDLLSRGMDFQGIKAVWNFEEAKNYTDYVHRVGRTGRMGNHGFAYSFGDPLTRLKKPG